MIALRILALAAFVFIQGWLVLSLAGGGSFSLDAMERLFLLFAAGISLSSLMAFFLVSLSSFDLVWLLVMAAVVDTAMLFSARERLFWIRRLRNKDIAGLLVVILTGIILFSPPWKIIFGWSDVGVYMSLAAHIQKEGGISIESEVVAGVSEENRNLLYHRESKRTSRETYFENQFFVIDDFENGTVRPWFYFFWPSLAAVFAVFLGVEHMFWSITAVSVLAFLGFFLLSRRLLKWRWAVIASLLMALNPLMLYFSRYTTSEMMNMMLFLAGSLCLVAYIQAENRWEPLPLALFSAFFFVLGMLCRIDFIVVAAPMLFCYLVRKVTEGFSQSDRWFIVTLSAGAVCAVLAGMHLSPTYFLSIWESTARFLWSPSLLVMAAAAIVFIVALFTSHNLKRMARRLVAARAIWITIFLVFLTGIFVYLYFIRPRGEDVFVGYGFIREMRGPSYANQNLVRWGWYFSFPVLVAAFAGYGLWFTRRCGFGELTLLSIGLTYTLLYAWDMRAMPMHILVMRRLVPVIMPMALLTLAYAAKCLAETSESNWIRTRSSAARSLPVVAAAATMFLTVVYFTHVSIPVMGLDEGGNQVDVCSRIATDIVEGGVVLMDNNAGDLFGVPLRCLFGIDNAWLSDNGLLAGESVDALLRDLGFPGKPVYLLWRPDASGRGVHFAESYYALKVGEYGFREDSLEKTFDRRPSRRDHISERFILYRIFPDDGKPV